MSKKLSLLIFVTLLASLVVTNTALAKPPPNPATNPSPADSATGVSITADLSWSAGKHATSHDVYFGTTSPGDSQGNQTATTFDTETMDYDETYYWRIDEIGTGGTTTGTVWSFTTESQPGPPGQATNPSPANSATDVSVNADLSWTAGSGATSRDVYFGTTSPGASQGNQTATTFDTDTMDYDETYYWRIDEINASGTTTGTVWSFTTEAAAPPGQATNPSPANSATDVSVTADLSWTAGSGATSRDVYFGTTSPGASQGNQTATTFETGTMDYDETYYWRIDEINASGTTTGTVWSFTTTSDVDTNLIGWWKLDDGEGGTAVDSGTGGNNGTVSGAQWVTGKLDGALDFDGEDDYVSIPTESDFDITSNITVAVWVKLNSQSTDNFMSFITKGHESAWALQRAARTGGVSFYLNGLTSWDGIKGTANVFDDQWHHIAGVYDGSRISVYVDGKEDTFLETTGSIGTNDWDVYIGANDEDVSGSTGYRYCDGLLDDARVYDRALSDEEIKELAGIDAALAWDPMPTDGAKTVDPNADLEWAAGSDATSHDVYFGTTFNDVNSATTSDDEYMGRQTATTYEPGPMDVNTDYYWRIDEVNTPNPDSPWKGNVWTFKTSTGLADECTNWETLHPEWIFCDDFEDETAMVRDGRYFAYDNDGGDCVVMDNVGVNGSRGLRVIFQEDEVTAGGMKLGFGRTPSSFDKEISNTEDFSEIYYRMYLKMEDGWTGNPAKLSRATIFHANDWSQAMIAHLWGDGGYRLLVDPVRCVDSSSEVVCIGYNDFNNMTWLGSSAGTTPIFDSDHDGTWFCVEAHVKLNTPGQSDGVQEFWIDGELETSKTGLNFVESYSDYGINIILFENYWNNGSPQLQERYFDSIVVSTEPIGSM